MRDIEMHPLRLIVWAFTAGLPLADSLVRRALLVTGSGALLMFAICTQSMAATINFPANGSGVLSNLSFETSFVSSRDAPVGTVLQMAAAGVGLNASGVTCNVSLPAKNGSLAECVKLTQGGS